MIYKPPFYYEARVAFGGAALLGALLLPGLALLGVVAWTTQERTPSLAEITPIFELGLTLSAGLLAAHLMTIEREDGFDAIRRTYPESAVRLPLIRTLGAVVMMLFGALLASGIFALSAGAYLLADVLIPALSPALVLLTLALLANNISGSPWAAIALVALVWFFEYQTLGAYTGHFFLFQSSFPLPDVDYDLNRALLVMIAGVLAALNVMYSIYRRRFGGD